MTHLQGSGAEGPSSRALQLWGSWEMWCEMPQRGGRQHPQQQPTSWLDSVRSIGQFETAQAFWAIHNCTKMPSNIPMGANYYLFRRNIPPMWEHEANRRGGKWVVQLQPEEGDRTDAHWTSLCLAAIGEKIPANEEEICGVSVSRRRSGYRISVWTRNAHDAKAQANIGFFVKVLLGLKAAGTLKYFEHVATLGTKAQSPIQVCSPKFHDAAQHFESQSQQITAAVASPQLNKENCFVEDSRKQTAPAIRECFSPPVSPVGESPSPMSVGSWGVTPKYVL